MSDYDSGSDDELELLRKNISGPQFDIGSLDFPSAFDLNNIDLNLLDANSPVGSGLFDVSGNINLENISALATDPELFAAFKEFDPASAALVADVLGGDYGFAPVGADNPVDAYERGSGEFLGENIKSGVPEWDKAATDAGLKLTDPNAKTSLLDKLKKGIADVTGLGEDTIGELGKYGLLAGIAKLAYDDAQRAREEAQGWSSPGGYAKQAVRSPGGGVTFKPAGKAAGGGIGSLDMTTKQPFYLGGVTDGMADKIPAHIDNKRPAALSDGEFVIPADVVSHLGNGNSNAGAKRLYEMMDNIREARTGNKNQGIQINPNQFMPR